MRPLKIALFSDSALPVLNGVSISIDALIRALRKRGHRVFLYTSFYPKHRDSDPNVTRFVSIPTPWFKDYPLAFPPFYPWFHEFKKQNFDIVHTHTPFTVGFVGLRWAQSCEIPVVTTYHTHYDKYVHYVPVFPKRFLLYKMAKHTNFYYNSVDHVVTPSTASLKWLTRHSVKKPISVIPTGVPEPENLSRDELRREMGVAPTKRVLLYTGRLAVEKNLGTMLEAAALVFDRVADCELWVVGDGPAREEAQAMARQLGIGDQVQFWGFHPRKEVSRFYAAADIFTFCSMTETQGLVVTEAMTYGLPAVVVNGGGASGAVTSGVDGFVVSNNPAEVAEKILLLFRDEKLYRQMSENAHEASRECTVEAMADRILQVYTSVLDRPVLYEETYVR